MFDVCPITIRSFVSNHSEDEDVCIIIIWKVSFSVYILVKISQLTLYQVNRLRLALLSILYNLCIESCGLKVHSLNACNLCLFQTAPLLIGVD